MTDLFTRQDPPLLALLFAFTLLTGVTGMSKSASTADIKVNYNGVREISIFGLDSRTIIHASRNAEPRLTVTEKGNNRFLCSTKAEVSRQADRLIIKIARDGLSLGINCDTTLELITPPELDLMIDQNASMTELDGAFGQVTLTSPTSFISFRGSLERFSVTGQQSMISANITPAQAGSSLVDINVDTLVADIGYPFTVPVDYRVDAPVSIFSKNIPLSTGAPHKMQISSKVIKGSVFGF